jgi:hypothetical protein
VSNNDRKPIPRICIQEATNEVFVMEEALMPDWLDSIKVLERVSVNLHKL